MQLVSITGLFSRSDTGSAALSVTSYEIEVINICIIKGLPIKSLVYHMTS